ncbi:hypothetical protein ING2D1G_0351 [Peptoniphilus sp. ING2-D1G]|nr:hypothetical protein ING2D1G_0351 [Peptoniphilus sp. ING2-D1G]
MNIINEITLGYEPYEESECNIDINNHFFTWENESDDMYQSEKSIETKDGKEILVLYYKNEIVGLEFYFDLKHLIKNIDVKDYIPIDDLFDYENEQDDLKLKEKSLQEILKEVFKKRGLLKDNQ